jgi:hypothetical protein
MLLSTGSSGCGASGSAAGADQSKTFRQALNAILDQVVRGKEWGREVTGRALLEMGTGWEGSRSGTADDRA